MIDCNIDKHRVIFGKGTGEHNYVEWMHTVEVHAIDTKSGLPVSGATVRIESERDSKQHMSLETTRRGRTMFEVLETIIRKNDIHDVTPHRVLVTMKGYEPKNLSGVEVDNELS